MFIFKKKPVDLIAFVEETYSAVNEFSPIVPASKVIPEWWKNTPAGEFSWDEMQSINTTKSCVGIINSLRAGFILPLWSELAIDVSDEFWKYKFSDNMSMATVHPNWQAPSFYNDHYFFKLHAPWLFRCSDDIKIAFNTPFYHTTEEGNYVTPPGVLSPVRGVYPVNIFIFVKKTANRFIIKPNTPMYHITPYTEREVVFKTEVLTNSEFSKYFKLMGYKNTFVAKGVKRKLFLYK